LLALGLGLASALTAASGEAQAQTYCCDYYNSTRLGAVRVTPTSCRFYYTAPSGCREGFCPGRAPGPSCRSCRTLWNQLCMDGAPRIMETARPPE